MHRDAVAALDLAAPESDARSSTCPDWAYTNGNLVERLRARLKE